MIIITASVLTLFAVDLEPTTQTDRFEFRRDRIEVGTVYRYIKSDLEGGNPAEVTVYISTEDHFEVLKHEQGMRDFAFVTADIDWETFSAKHIASWNLLPTGLYRRQAHMRFDGETHMLSVWMPGASEEVKTEHYPFHIYNFDFLSLNYVFRHLKNPEGSVDIGIVDPTWNDSGPRIAYQGLAHIEYVGDEDYKGTPCQKYKVGGPGLNDEFGWIWVDRDRGHFVNVEHPWRDNPDWTSFKLELQSMDRMTLSEWHAFLDAECEKLRQSIRR